MHQALHQALPQALPQVDPKHLRTNWEEAPCKLNKQQWGPYLEVEAERHTLQVLVIHEEEEALAVGQAQSLEVEAAAALGSCPSCQPWGSSVHQAGPVPVMAYCFWRQEVGPWQQTASLGEKLPDLTHPGQLRKPAPAHCPYDLLLS